MHWGLKAGAAPAGPDIPTEAPARSGVGSGLPWGPRFALSSSQSLSRPDTIYLFTARLLLRAQEFVGWVCMSPRHGIPGVRKVPTQTPNLFVE